MSSEFQDSLSVYFAGELFSSKHLFGNAVLAEAIWDVSKGRYHCALPQNMEKRWNTAQSIRDEDIKSVISADIGLFNYDGPELDSGTVVEYLFAKFADIPSVLLRTDFRKGGDQEKDAWNLMTSFFPRTEIVMIDSMSLYKEMLFASSSTVTSRCIPEKRISSSAYQMICQVAKEVVEAMDRVVKKEPIMPKDMRETIYQWLAKVPGFQRGDQEELMHFLSALQRKVERKLI